MECKYVHFRLVGVARDSLCFGCLDLGELAPKEAFQVQVKEEAVMVGEDDLVEWINPELLYEWKNSGRDENIVQALGAAAVGAGFSIGAMCISMWVSKVTLGDEVCKAILTVAETFIEVASKDNIGARLLAARF